MKRWWLNQWADSAPRCKELSVGGAEVIGFPHLQNNRLSSVTRLSLNLTMYDLSCGSQHGLKKITTYLCKC